MTKTAVGVTVTVQYYGEKSLNFNFPCVDEAVENRDRSEGRL